MRTIIKRPRRLMQVRNRDRVNRLRNQQIVFSPLFILVLISLKLREQNTPEKTLVRLRLHIEKLTGNANFPTTDPSVANLEAMEVALMTSIDKVNAGDHSEIPTRDGLDADAKEMIRQLSYHIQFLSKGDATKIQSAGFDIPKPKTPAPAPGQIMGLVAKAVGPGKIKLTWNKEDHSSVYVIEQGVAGPIPGGPMNWQLQGKTRVVSFVVTDLNPGQLYYFRVFGTNGNEDGNPSDPAEQRSL